MSSWVASFHTELLRARSVEAARASISMSVSMSAVEGSPLTSQASLAAPETEVSIIVHLSLTGPIQAGAKSRAPTYIDLYLCAIGVLNGGIITLDPFVVDELGCEIQSALWSRAVLPIDTHQSNNSCPHRLL